MTPDMRIRHRARAAVLAAIATCLLAGCATNMSEGELGARLDRAGRTVASRQAVRRVVPVYAQTRMEAWVLRTEAKMDPESSPLSLQLADGFELGGLRTVDYVVGGPYPALSDQILLNALRMNEGRPLPGLRIVLVSPDAPSLDLRRAAKARRARLEHRALD